MNRRQKQTLIGFTTAELEAEIAHRQSGKVEKLPWYFCKDEEDDEAEDAMKTLAEMSGREFKGYCRLAIIHKRHYHVEHTYMDYHITDKYLKGLLPDGIGECMEGVFDAGMSYEQARQLMLKAGFEELVDPQFHMLLTHMIKLGESNSRYRVSIQPDTKAISTLLQGTLLSTQEFSSWERYAHGVSVLAKEHNLNFHFYGNYGDFADGGVRLSIMDQKTWDSLPLELAEED